MSIEEHEHKIHFKAIFGNLGLLIQVPSLMELFSIIIALIFNEKYALAPFFITGIIGLIVGQVLYRSFYHPRAIHIWDAMITAAFGWLLCSFIAFFPFIFTCIYSGMDNSAVLSLKQPVNALFESISGFTSTGLSMVEKPSELPHILQWWRTFLEWIGAIGLVVFIISLVKSKKEEARLYYAEARRNRFGTNIKETSRIIWAIYFFYTIVAFVVYLLLGMPVWDSINHAMSGIATGGFTITDQSFEGYSLSIQIATMLIMIVGTLSFSVHYEILRKGKFSDLWKNSESRTFFFLLFIGFLLIILFNRWTDIPADWNNSMFQWISALGTCGFHTTEITTFAPIVRLLFIFGMIIGGASDSTTGGIKIKRFRNLLTTIRIQIKYLIKEKQRLVLREKKNTGIQTDVSVPISEKTRRILPASILFILWISVLFLGWLILLRWIPSSQAFNALFDTASALSNVGLSTGITTPALPLGAKIVLMVLMWLGRLEIIPILILSYSMIFFYKKK